MSYSAEVLADLPLLYWRIGETNGATTAVDASGNSRAGTYHYGSSFTRLVLGATGALLGDTDTGATWVPVDGSAAGVDIAYAAWMDVSTLTLECWVKTTATGVQPLWDRDPGGGQRPWQLRLNSGKFEFVRICNAAGSIAVVTAQSTGTVNDGNWHHLVATYDGSTIKLYVDGVAANGAGTAAAGGITVTSVTTDLRFGWSLGASATYTDGKGDELSYYGTVLSSARIAAHYAAGTTVSASASGSGALALSGSGAAQAAATATGALALSASGNAGIGASGSGSLALAASGAIDFQPASGSGVLALAGLGAAGIGVAGTGALTLAGTGTAVGSTAASGSGSLALSAAGAATLAASGTASLTLGAIGTAFALFVTDLTNALNGRRRHARGTATVTRAAASPPPGRTFAKRYDKAIAYPNPDMVDGRPE